MVVWLLNCFHDNFSPREFVMKLALALTALSLVAMPVHADSIAADNIDTFTFQGLTWELPASPILGLRGRNFLKRKAAH